MIHLPPLPGAPGFTPSEGRSPLAGIVERVRRDARILVEEGVDGILVENFGDAPFHPGRVPPETVAALTLAVSAAQDEAAGLPVGLNVLRNDARSGVGIAVATGADFLRINVHTGTMFTDQGMLEGRAWETVRERERLCPSLLILADVEVKHAAPPPGVSRTDAARDLRLRGFADVLVVSGSGTGRPTDPAVVDEVRAAVTDAPVWVGSGLSPTNARELLGRAEGAIVGSALMEGGRPGGPIDPGRVRQLLDAARG
ncbi:MAG: phosphorybosylanthranilate isomerase [Gemmatimonadales bacterium]|nr:MAG: phosphorybosylanthranilate isomerase [Gemmatimonadales bacterium]